MRFPFHTKVVGVSHDNDDGTSRQAIIRACSVGEQLHLVRDRANQYDHDAIRVLRADGEQVGFIRAELATELAPYMDRGTVVIATVTGLTGGAPGETHGVNILISEVASARAGVPSWLRDEYAPLNGNDADLSFLDGEAEKIESHYVRHANRSLFAAAAASIRRWFSAR